MKLTGKKRSSPAATAASVWLRRGFLSRRARGSPPPAATRRHSMKRWQNSVKRARLPGRCDRRGRPQTAVRSAGAGFRKARHCVCQCRHLRPHADRHHRRSHFRKGDSRRSDRSIFYRQFRDAAAERQRQHHFNGSVHNYLGQPGLAAYAAAKGGLVSMARVIAADLATRNIRVNVVAPGLDQDAHLETRGLARRCPRKTPTKKRSFLIPGSAGAFGPAGGNCEGGAVPRLGRCVLRERRRVGGGWRTHRRAIGSAASSPLTAVQVPRRAGR